MLTRKNTAMAWHDNSTCCFVFNSNVGQLDADMAASTLRKEFAFPCITRNAWNTFSIEHSFCLTTSKEPGLLNTGVNPDIVQVSCLLLNINIQLTSDFQLACGKDSVGCLLKCVGITVDEFKALSSAERVGLAEVLLQSNVSLAPRLEVLDCVTEVVDRLTSHVKSVNGNVDFVRKQLKAASFVLHRCAYLLKDSTNLTSSPLQLGNSDLAEWNAIGDPCECCSSKHSLVDMLLVPCRNGKISFHQSRKQRDRFQWPVEKLLALRLHDLKNVVMQKLLTGSIYCWGIAKVALEESIESDSETDNDEDDHAENDHAENEVLPVRSCIDVKKQKKSSLLTLSQMFTDTSQSYMGCVGLVVALCDVLDEMSTPEHFDFASIVSRGVVIMGSDWVDSKHSTLRVRPCISSDEDLCVCFSAILCFLKQLQSRC